MSDNERPDLVAFQELEHLIHALADEMAGWRRRAQEAEARLKAAPPAPTGRVNAAALEKENRELRERLDAANDSHEAAAREAALSAPATGDGGTPMSRKSSVKVTIVGEEYTIRSDEPAEHTRAVAKYVDETIRGVMNAGATVESHKAAILAALQITDELFKTQDGREELAERMRGLSVELRRLLPPGKRGV